MTSHFISDLHLGAENPKALKLLKKFVQEQCREGDRLYILGDLFEHWVGDDVSLRANREAVNTLADCSASGVKLYFMYGNRDFLIRDAFLERTGCELIDDPTVVDINGERLLLMHGDLLCTDDHKYQQFRAWARQDETQRKFLRKPKIMRSLFVKYVRFNSKRRQKQSHYEIIDVTNAAVEATMRAHNVHFLLHGHTHRANIHRFDLDGELHYRIVLSDWHDSAKIVSIADDQSLADVALTDIALA